MAEIGNPIPEERSKEALNFILENCFRSGFGTLNKSELDLILFTTLMKYAETQNLSEQALSKYLQVTKQRVRNLQEKASVKYLTVLREDAVSKFVEKAAHAKLDDKYIDIPIYDIAVRNEIEALLDENNVLLHSQLNPKIFRIRIDDFVEIVVQIEAFGSKKPPEVIQQEVIAGVRLRVRDDDDFRNKIGLPSGATPEQMTKKTLTDVHAADELTLLPR